METSVLVVALIFAALIAVVVVYFARTTWLAQNRAHEMAHMAITAALSTKKETVPIAATLASRGSAVGYTREAPGEPARLVRTPLAELQRDPNEIYDDEEELVQ